MTLVHGTFERVRRGQRGRRGPGTLYRRWKSLEFLATRDRRHVAAFLRGGGWGNALERFQLVFRYVQVTNQVRGYHTLGEMLRVASAILERDQPVVVEAGCGSGSSTAKLSLAVRAAGGRLIAYDSFQGIPPNEEVHENLDGRRVVFRPKAFVGRRARVWRTITQWGAPEVVELRKGWFEETLPDVDVRPDVVLLDVDLVASTRICLRAFFPRLKDTGVLFSQDGHLRATHDLLRDSSFWSGEVRRIPRVIHGLGHAKLLEIRP